MSSQNIKSVLVEERRFPPSAEFTARARLKPADVAALRAEAAADHQGFWARQAADRTALAQAVHGHAGRIAGAELPLVHRRRAQRLPQLPRRAPRGARPQDRGHLRRRAGRRAPRVLSRAACRRVPVRQCAAGAGREAGRSRGHLHADGARGDRRDARLRAHRRHPFGGVRRVLGAVAQGPHRGCRRRGADHRRWRLARRQGRRAQGSRRQGAVAGLPRASARSSCSSAPARTCTCIRGAISGGTTSSRASRRSASPCGSMPSIRCSCCTPRAPPASPRASSIRAPAIYSAPSSPASGCSTSTTTTSSGAPPTSAGSPATATSPTARWRPARPSSSTKARRRSRMPGRFWKICESLGVTIFYTAPTAIRALMKLGDDIPARYDLTKLRLLGSVGEPINPEAWMWYHEHIGRMRCPIVDTWWQTETGAIMISPLPGVTATKPGSCTQPLPGIDATIVDARGDAVQGADAGGYLVDPQALAVDVAHDLGRQRALPQDLLGNLPEPLLRRRRLRASRQGRLLLDHGPHRRRAERRRPSPRHDGDRIRAGRASESRRGRGGRQAARHQGRVGVRVRRAARRASDRRRRSKRSPRCCATGSPSSSAPSRGPTTSASPTICRRRARARSCAACCAPSRATRTSRRICRRSRIRRSSISCAATNRPAEAGEGRAEEEGCREEEGGGEAKPAAKRPRRRKSPSAKTKAAPDEESRARKKRRAEESRRAKKTAPKKTAPQDSAPARAARSSRQPRARSTRLSTATKWQATPPSTNRCHTACV